LHETTNLVRMIWYFIHNQELEEANEKYCIIKNREKVSIPFVENKKKIEKVELSPPLNSFSSGTPSICHRRRCRAHH
jgi:hypothetical protein